MVCGPSGPGPTVVVGVDSVGGARSIASIRTVARAMAPTFDSARPSFYLLNVGETHYPYAKPDEDSAQRAVTHYSVIDKAPPVTANVADVDDPLAGPVLQVDRMQRPLEVADENGRGGPLRECVCPREKT